MQTKSKNLDGYGAPTIEWERVRDVLIADLTQAPETGGPGRHTAWLTTINQDGSPHTTPVGVAQLAGSWYFTSGPGTRKAQNLLADARCTVSVATHPFDLVVEGRAVRVSDAAELRSVASEYNTAGWPAQVDGDALTADFSAPSAGPPPWHVYKIIPATVFAFGTAEPHGATRFDITDSTPRS